MLVISGIIVGVFLYSKRRKSSRPPIVGISTSTKGDAIPLDSIATEKKGNLSSSSNSDNLRRTNEKNGNSEADSSNNKSQKEEKPLPLIAENSILIKKQIARGSYATVYYGKWQGTPVLLKVT